MPKPATVSSAHTAGSAPPRCAAGARRSRRRPAACRESVHGRLHAPRPAPQRRHHRPAARVGAGCRLGRARPLRPRRRPASTAAPAAGCSQLRDRRQPERRGSRHRAQASRRRAGAGGQCTRLPSGPADGSRAAARTAVDRVGYRPPRPAAQRRGLPADEALAGRGEVTRVDASMAAHPRAFWWGTPSSLMIAALRWRSR